MKRVDEGIDPHNIIITLFVGEGLCALPKKYIAVVRCARILPLILYIIKRFKAIGCKTNTIVLKS